MIWQSVAGAAAVIAALLGVKAYIQADEIADLKLQIKDAKIAAVQQSNDWAQNVIAAVNEGERRAKIAKSNADAAADESAGLRSMVDVLTATIDTISEDAVRKYASAAGGLLSECSERYQGVAEKAQGHFNDTLKLQDAWPKESK